MSDCYLERQELRLVSPKPGQFPAPIHRWFDLKELSRQGVSAFALLPFYLDEGPLPPATDFCLAPVMMFFIYARAKKFQLGARLIQEAGARMGGPVIVGLAVLFLTRGRDLQAGRGETLPARGC
jgi:hypothetical protein